MASLQDILAAKAKKQSPVPTQPVSEATSETSVESSSPSTSTVGQSLTTEVTSTPSSISQEHSELLTKIRHLSEVPEADLKTEMNQLKVALLANPAAVELMLPEDIGLMVENLRRIVGEAIAAASAPKERKTKSKQLTGDELQAAFDEL
jgi:hypothetical protein